MSLSVLEYGRLELALDPQDLAYLLRLTHNSPDGGEEARVIRALTPTAIEGRYRIDAGGYVGRIGLPSGRQIDFVSRFHTPTDTLALILASQRAPARPDRMLVRAEVSTFLVDLIAEAYLRETERIVASGLQKGYQSLTHTLPLYGGRIDAAQHLSRFAGRADRLVTVSHRLSADIDANRVLASAVQVLRRTPLGPETALNSLKVSSAFGQIRPLRMALTAVSAVRESAPPRYRGALALAELILRADRIAPQRAGLRGASILFRMPTVWENYVSKWVRSTFPNHRVETNYRFPLAPRTEAPDLWAEADVIVRRREADGMVLGIFDAKYKRFDASPSRADVYQMVAYCERLGANRATLVYPVHVDPRDFLVGTKVVRVMGLPPPY